MAKNNNRISVNAFEKAVGENYNKAEIVEWNGLEVEIRKNLTLGEILLFARCVTEACFDKDMIDYKPEKKDFAIRTLTVLFYTNISLPKDVYKQYDLIYGSDIFETIIANINRDQFRTLVDAIDDKIANAADSNAALLNKQMNQLNDAFHELEEQAAGIFGDITSDDLKNLVDALADGGIDEEKMMKAYIENKSTGEE